MSHNKKMTTLFIAVALLVFAFVVGIWWYVFFGKMNPPLTRANVSIQSSSSTAVATTSSVVASGATAVSAPGADQLDIAGATFNVEIASTSVEQARGLSYRASLGENDGMLFIFSAGTIQTFWMKDMHFPLDMIWICGTTVDGFAQIVPAPASGAQLWQLPVYSSPDNTDKVLEVNAGTVAKYNIKVGDAVTIGTIE